jgi:hypothetical protein
LAVLRVTQARQRTHLLYFSQSSENYTEWRGIVKKN